MAIPFVAIPFVAIPFVGQPWIHFYRSYREQSLRLASRILKLPICHETEGVDGAQQGDRRCMGVWFAHVVLQLSLT